MTAAGGYIGYQIGIVNEDTAKWMRADFAHKEVGAAVVTLPGVPSWWPVAHTRSSGWSFTAGLPTVSTACLSTAWLSTHVCPPRGCPLCACRLL